VPQDVCAVSPRLGYGSITRTKHEAYLNLEVGMALIKRKKDPCFLCRVLDFYCPVNSCWA